MKEPFSVNCIFYYADGAHLKATINHSSVFEAIRDGWTSYDQNVGQERVWINLAHCARIVEEVDTNGRA
jgi:hypothetical protein